MSLKFTFFLFGTRMIAVNLMLIVMEGYFLQNLINRLKKTFHKPNVNEMYKMVASDIFCTYEHRNSTCNFKN